ncbi:MAG: hypothetical protein ACP6IY_22475, partial [Promethearchaeia archaeon]
MTDKIDYMRIHYPGVQSGQWIRAESCPFCLGNKSFTWFIGNGDWKCYKCGKSGSPYDFGYRDKDFKSGKKEFSQLEKIIWSYRKKSGKKHRLSNNVLKNFQLKIKPIKFVKDKKAVYIDKLCFCIEDKPIKYLLISKTRQGWNTVTGVRGQHILNLGNLDKMSDTVYILAGEWDLFSFWENTSIHGITLSGGE